jgi:hypothetical protein
MHSCAVSFTLASVLCLAACTTIENATPTAKGEPLYAPSVAAVSPAPSSAAVRRVKVASARATEPSDCGTIDTCVSQLKAMIDDPERSWVGQRQPPILYAQGTRLFAYRATRSQLSCDKLGVALNEVRAATKTFGGPVPGLTPEKISHVRALNAEVHDELQAEHATRCSAHSEQERPS